MPENGEQILPLVVAPVLRPCSEKYPAPEKQAGTPIPHTAIDVLIA